METISSTPLSLDKGAVAPEYTIDSWLQGEPTTLADLHGDVILIEVFQVNCPGCFIHALPEVVNYHNDYKNEAFTVIGIATAFEDFEHNTIDNLKHLLSTGEVSGEPLAQLGKAGFLEKNRLPYELPFRIAMDKLNKSSSPSDQHAIEQFILQQIPDFHQGSYSEERKQKIIAQASSYLKNKQWSPQTFERYRLQGTPSSILIDKAGLIDSISFGQVNHLKEKIEALL